MMEPSMATTYVPPTVPVTVPDVPSRSMVVADNSPHNLIFDNRQAMPFMIHNQQAHRQPLQVGPALRAPININSISVSNQFNMFPPFPATMGPVGTVPAVRRFAF